MARARDWLGMWLIRRGLALISNRRSYWLTQEMRAFWLTAEGRRVLGEWRHNG